MYCLCFRRSEPFLALAWRYFWGPYRTQVLQLGRSGGFLRARSDPRWTDETPGRGRRASIGWLMAGYLCRIMLKQSTQMRKAWMKLRERKRRTLKPCEEDVCLSDDGEMAILIQNGDQGVGCHQTKPYHRWTELEIRLESLTSNTWSSLRYGVAHDHVQWRINSDEAYCWLADVQNLEIHATL